MYTSLRDDVRRLCVAGLRFAPVPESCMHFIAPREAVQGVRGWWRAACRAYLPAGPLSLFTINTSHT